VGMDKILEIILVKLKNIFGNLKIIKKEIES
jgi:hypothetical protein